jgi:hypothetical protein
MAAISTKKPGCVRRRAAAAANGGIIGGVAGSASYQRGIGIGGKQRSDWRHGMALALARGKTAAKASWPAAAAAAASWQNISARQRNGESVAA